MEKEVKLANSYAENNEVSTTVIESNSKEEIMKKEETIATNEQVAEEVAANDKQQEEIDCECEENTPKRRTWKAVINGESQDIIIAFTDYNMEIPKKKHELFKQILKELFLLRKSGFIC